MTDDSATLTRTEARAIEVAYAAEGPYAMTVLYGYSTRTREGQVAFLNLNSLKRLVELGYGEWTEDGWVRLYPQEA